MSWWSWHPSRPYTVGIEEEVMLLDPDTWALSQRAHDVLATVGDDLAANCSAETHQAALELRTGSHQRVADAITELAELRSRLERDVARRGIAVATCGMYPGVVEEPIETFPGARAELIDRTMRVLAHREPTFALHVHVGVADAEDAIRLVNRFRAHLPLLLGLSASSPFWGGVATGLASNRTILFQAFPRTGLPRGFSDYQDWVEGVDALIRSGAIPEPTFLWWDIRPQPRFGTVEVRIMDSQPRLRDTATLAALVQALARLELEDGYASSALAGSQEVLSENRFLAARDGVAAELIDPTMDLRVPLVALLDDLLVAARPHAEALDAGAELAQIETLVASPEVARQLTLNATAGIGAVVADLASQFSAG